jgi:rhomboid protease GluP
MFDSQDDSRKQAPAPYADPFAETELETEPSSVTQEPFGRPEFYIALAKPRWTYVLMTINLLVFVAMIVYGQVVFNTWNGPENLQVLVIFGAKVNELIVRGEYWRLFTAMFIHIGVLHLLFNLYALYLFGPMVEGYYGNSRFLIIYLLGGLFGSLASFAFSPAISAGASGAIFALAGAITVYFLKYHENFGQRGRAILQNMAFIIVINLIFGFVGRGIDNWGHIGGLIGGAVVAWGLIPRYSVPKIVQLDRQPLEREPRASFELLWVLLMIALFAFGVQFAMQITPLTF